MAPYITPLGHYGHYALCSTRRGSQKHVGFRRQAVVFFVTAVAQPLQKRNGRCAAASDAKRYESFSGCMRWPCELAAVSAGKIRRLHSSGVGVFFSWRPTPRSRPHTAQQGRNFHQGRLALFNALGRAVQCEFGAVGAVTARKPRAREVVKFKSKSSDLGKVWAHCEQAPPLCKFFYSHARRPRHGRKTILSRAF